MISSVINRALAGHFGLIAEIGVNFFDIAVARGVEPMEAAKSMVDEARAAGIHAVKFQSYKATSLTVRDSPAYWDLAAERSTSQFELFSKYDSFGEREFCALASYCEETGIEFLSTPFDTESADYLSPLMHVFKISSSDLNNLPFIDYIARKQKPIIMSTGASFGAEIHRALSTIRQHNDHPIVLMHCVLEYPTPYERANLNRVSALAEAFPDVIAGYSDHTRPDGGGDVVKTAFLLGALVVEKHFTLDKGLPGNDHYHAMDPSDARRILDGIQFLELIRGSSNLDSPSTEGHARRNARRSLVATRPIPAGSVISSDMLTAKRPGTGISPSNLDVVVGRTACRNINPDETLVEDMFQ